MSRDISPVCVETAHCPRHQRNTRSGAFSERSEKVPLAFSGLRSTPPSTPRVGTRCDGLVRDVTQLDGHPAASDGLVGARALAGTGLERSTLDLRVRPRYGRTQQRPSRRTSWGRPRTLRGVSFGIHIAWSLDTLEGPPRSVVDAPGWHVAKSDRRVAQQLAKQRRLPVPRWVGGGGGGGGTSVPRRRVVQ